MTKQATILEHASAQALPRCDFRVDYCAATQQGSTHEKNEDAHLCRPGIGLFGIADGMGGHAAGDLASRVSLQCIERVLGSAEAGAVLERYVRLPDIEARRGVFALLKRAFAAANEGVLSSAQRHGGDKGMGSTLDIVLLVRDRAFVAHLGDSRAYLVRPMATLQLTHDHALYDSLQQTGKRTAVKRWIKSPLARHIGSTKRQVVDTLSVDLKPGDKLVLCTDGAYVALDEERDFGALAEGGPEAVCRGLIASSVAQGHGDDATVLTLRIGDRFVARSPDAGPRAEDLAVALTSPLLCDLAPPLALAALQAAVEVELEEGARIERAVAGDRVAYVVLDGLVQLPSGRTLGASGLLFPESLLDVAARTELPTVAAHARLLRIRHDDFVEVCNHDPTLAAGLYQRLARHLATLGGTSS